MIIKVDVPIFRTVVYVFIDTPTEELIAEIEHITPGFFDGFELEDGESVKQYLIDNAPDGTCLTSGAYNYIWVKEKSGMTNIKFLRDLAHECMHYTYRAFEHITNTPLGRSTEEVQVSLFDYLYGEVLEIYKKAKAEERKPKKTGGKDA